MENSVLRKQMMKLWKNTFHDSDDYISLVFDTYFTPDFVAYREENGNVISAMLSVPYTFALSDNFVDKDCCDPMITISPKYNNRTNSGVPGSDDESNLVKGLYLCGLMTSPSHRGAGIMGELIEEMNLRAMRMGFAFTFLIPSSDGLRRYYVKHGYFNASFRRVNRYMLDCYLTTDCITNNDCIESLLLNLKNHEIDHSLTKDMDCMSDLFVESDKCKILYSYLCNNSIITLSNLCEYVYEIIRGISKDICVKYHVSYIDIFKIIIEYISEIFHCFEMKNNDCLLGLNLRHGIKDWEAILTDNFIDNGDVCVCINHENLHKNIDKTIKCDVIKSAIEKHSVYEDIKELVKYVVKNIFSIVSISSFACISRMPDENIISVPHIFSDSLDSYYRLLNYIVNRIPNSILEVYSDPNLTHGVGTDEAKMQLKDYKLRYISGNVEPYGMIRPTNLSQILKFADRLPEMPDFLILRLVDSFSNVSYKGLRADNIRYKFLERLDICSDKIDLDLNFVNNCIEGNVWSDKTKSMSDFLDSTVFATLSVSQGALSQVLADETNNLIEILNAGKHANESKEFHLYGLMSPIQYSDEYYILNLGKAILCILNCGTLYTLFINELYYICKNITEKSIEYSVYEKLRSYRPKTINKGESILGVIGKYLLKGSLPDSDIKRKYVLPRLPLNLSLLLD